MYEKEYGMAYWFMPGLPCGWEQYPDGVIGDIEKVIGHYESDSGQKEVKRYATKRRADREDEIRAWGDQFDLMRFGRRSPTFLEEEQHTPSEPLGRRILA